MSLFARIAFQIGAGFIVTAIPLVAGAFDLTPDTTRYLSDPAYLPLHGELFSATTISRNVYNEDWQPAGRPIVEHYKAVINGYGELVSYGITDRLSASAAGSYSDTKGYYTFSFQQPESAQKGRFNNPTVSATYRALEQAGNPMSVDVSASYVPPISDTLPGSESLRLYVNRELQSLTVQGEFGVTRQDSYSGDNTLSDVPSRVSALWAYFGGVRTQFRLTSQWAINAGLVYSNTRSYSVRRPEPYIDYTSSSTAAVTPYVTIAYDFVPRRCNLAFEYDHDTVSNRNLSGDIFGSWINQSRNLYALRLRVLF